MAAADFYMKVDDTEPSLVVTCIDENGDPVPLGAATNVVFNLINPGTETPKLSGVAASIVDAPNGVVKHDWLNGETDERGDFNGEFLVTWSGGKETSFPNFRYIKIRFSPRIA